MKCPNGILAGLDRVWCYLSTLPMEFDINGVNLGQGKQNLVQNSGEFKVAEF